MSEIELERELHARAERRGLRFVVGPRASGDRWKASFRQSAGDTPLVEVLSAESPDRRQALEELYLIDEQDRVNQRRRRDKRVLAVARERSGAR